MMLAFNKSKIDTTWIQFFELRLDRSLSDSPDSMMALKSIEASVGLW